MQILILKAAVKLSKSLGLPYEVHHAALPRPRKS
jgi:hypothetical protein